MHFEYAVEPEAMGSSWENFRYLIEKFGFSRGRLISRFPNKWEKKVVQAAKSAGMSELKLASLVDRLNRAKQDKFLGLVRAYDPNSDWLENAIKQNEQLPFHAVITSKKTAHDFVVAIDELDEDQVPLLCNRNCQISQTGNGISAALSSLLVSARVMLFIDPYFDISNRRYKEILRSCLAVIASSKNQGIQCEVHFGDMDGNISTEIIEREAKNWLKNVIPKGISIKFFAWKRKKNGADFHDRFFLTDLGGVQLGTGFLARGAAQTVNMSLLDTSFSENERANFKMDTTVYDLAGPVIEVFFDGRVVRI